MGVPLPFLTYGHEVLTSGAVTVKGYTGHRQTLLSVREISLKARGLTQILWPDWGLNPGRAGNLSDTVSTMDILIFAKSRQRRAVSFCTWKSENSQLANVCWRHYVRTVRCQTQCNWHPADNYVQTPTIYKQFEHTNSCSNAPLARS